MRSMAFSMWFFKGWPIYVSEGSGIFIWNFRLGKMFEIQALNIHHESVHQGFLNSSNPSTLHMTSCQESLSMLSCAARINNKHNPPLERHRNARFAALIQHTNIYAYFPCRHLENVSIWASHPTLDKHIILTSPREHTYLPIASTVVVMPQLTNEMWSLLSQESRIISQKGYDSYRLSS